MSLEVFMNKTSPIVVAVDGLSCSGKSMISKAIARHFGYQYLDTGSIYRAITLLALKNGLNINSFDETEKSSYEPLLTLLKNTKFKFNYDKEQNTANVFLNDKDVTLELKTPVVSNNVAKVSKIESVRVWVRGLQYSLASGQNIVVEGRDITTVVFPNAKFKIFVTTDIDERANRRAKDYEKLGKFVSIETVKKDLEERDHLDTFRKNSPLKVATDAFVLDTTNSTVEESVAEAIAFIENKMKEIKKK